MVSKKQTYVPQRITLTRHVGFDEETSRRLGELAERQGIDDPRRLAAGLLRDAVQRVIEHLEGEES